MIHLLYTQIGDNAMTLRGENVNVENIQIKSRTVLGLARKRYRTILQ